MRSFPLTGSGEWDEAHPAGAVHDATGSAVPLSEAAAPAIPDADVIVLLQVIRPAILGAGFILHVHRFPGHPGRGEPSLPLTAVGRWEYAHIPTSRVR